MPSPLRVNALDAALDLTLPSDAPAAFVSAVRQAWSRCLAQPDDAAPSVTAEPLAVAAPPDDSAEAFRQALQRLSQDVTHRLIAAQTGTLLMFHAGAVCDPDSGASVVFVAPSGTGKTTLARLLGRTHGYLTDETVGIDPGTGRLHPYPKPLSIAASPGERWRKVETSPDALGLQDAHTPPPPSSGSFSSIGATTTEPLAPTASPCWTPSQPSCPRLPPSTGCRCRFRP